jgi:hypothetical protein
MLQRQNLFYNLKSAADWAPTLSPRLVASLQAQDLDSFTVKVMSGRPQGTYDLIANQG